MIPLVSLAEVARLLCVSKITVRRLVSAGELPVIRLSQNGPLRFDTRDVERFIEKRKA